MPLLGYTMHRSLRILNLIPGRATLVTAIPVPKAKVLPEAQEFTFVRVTLAATIGSPSASVGHDAEAGQNAILAETAQESGVVAMQHLYGRQVGNSAIKGLCSKESGCSTAQDHRVTSLELSRRAWRFSDTLLCVTTAQRILGAADRPCVAGSRGTSLGQLKYDRVENAILCETTRCPAASEMRWRDGATLSLHSHNQMPIQQQSGALLRSLFGPARREHGARLGELILAPQGSVVSHGAYLLPLSVFPPCEHSCPPSVAHGDAPFLYGIVLHFSHAICTL